MIGPLLSLAAGLALFVVLSFVWLKEPVRKFWISRTITALALGVVLWKLTPLWTRWETVFGNPLLLLSMNGGLTAWFGAGFAFFTVVLLSAMQVRRQTPGTPRRALLVPVFAGVFLAGGAGLLEPVVFPPRGADPGVVAEAQVPDLEGRLHALSEWKGKVVVVNFWATWCPPCLAELPEFQAFALKRSDKVVVIGVNLVGTEKEGERGVVKFASQNKLTWTQLTDPQGVLQQAFGVTSIPTTVVLSPEGRVVDRRVGAVDLFWLQTLEARFAP